MAPPRATYRLQLTPDFGFDAAIDVLDYLAALGVSHVYTSPLLEAEPGSPHGYDVVDHHRVREELGGVEGLHRFWEALATHGLGQVVDIVPNHLSIVGGRNRWFNDVVASGEASTYAEYFDIDWLPPDPDSHHKVVLPFLPDDGDASSSPWPPSPYARPVSWRDAPELLNYRRFFDITGLAAVRVEVPRVFDDVHRLLVEWLEDPVGGSIIDGVRVDHIDGLVDPTGYLRRLRSIVGDRWVIVEKILGPDEVLPDDWDTAGTTGYEFAALTTRLLTDPIGEQALTDTARDLAGVQAPWRELVDAAKHEIGWSSLRPELSRLTRAWTVAASVQDQGSKQRRAPSSVTEIEEVLLEAACALDVYRLYPPEPVIGRDDVAVDDPAVTTRFAQLTAPLAAKAVEDTACYRDVRLLSLNEVGGAPDRFGAGVAELHDAMARAATARPAAMLCLSTHDTKRSADVRARLGVLAQIPDEWHAVAAEWFSRNGSHRSATVNGPAPSPRDEYLLYQTVVGAWPIDAARATANLLKAVHEAKVRSSWTDPSADYDQAVVSFVEGVLADREFVASVESFVGRLVGAGRVASLAQVALLLTTPGVPDLYQGDELWDLALVDPDNRRPVDFDARRDLLEQVRALDAGELWGEAAAWGGDELGLAKLALIDRLLGLRRARPEVFDTGGYTPIHVDGPGADQVAAFARGVELAVVVPRWTLSRETWRDGPTVMLATGPWTDVITGSSHRGGPTSSTDLFHSFPVAVLERSRPTSHRCTS